MTYDSKHVIVAHNGNKTCIDRLWRSLERADIESILEEVEIVASNTTVVTAYRLYVDATKLKQAQKLLEDRNCSLSSLQPPETPEISQRHSVSLCRFSTHQREVRGKTDREQRTMYLRSN
jgi:hypothetical protein